MGIKIIFLDVDGVLNCAKTTKRLDVCFEFNFVDTRKVLRLRDVVERTGAKLVLSSTWRFGADPRAFYLEREALRELVAEFRRLRCPLWFDITPYLPRAKRWQEINAWLLLHPKVDEYIVLDDWGEDEFRPMMDHLVKCDPRKGLTKERAELAIQMLGEKENE
jgi:hypothetical protein